MVTDRKRRTEGQTSKALAPISGRGLDDVRHRLAALEDEAERRADIALQDEIDGAHFDSELGCFVWQDPAGEEQHFSTVEELRHWIALSSEFCANRVWYDRFKPLLVRLVGYEARLEELRTEAAYDLAYETLYDRLPACRHESTAFCL